MGTWTKKETLTPGWDAGAISVAQLSGCGGYKWKVGQATGIVCGLAFRDSSPSYHEIDFGFFIQANDYQIVERGHFAVSTFTSHSPGDEFKIQREAGVVTYYVNDELVYTSNERSEGPVFLKSSLFAYGDEITDFEIFYLQAAFGKAVLSPLAGFGLTEDDDDAALGRATLHRLTGQGSEDTSGHGQVRLQKAHVNGYGSGDDEAPARNHQHNTRLLLQIRSNRIGSNGIHGTTPWFGSVMI